MNVKSSGSSKEWCLLEGVQQDSLEKVFGLGLEGWIEVFHVKEAEGYSKKRDYMCKGPGV